MEVHNYVPMKDRESIDQSTHKVVCDDLFHAILLGGDQLTRKRVETAKELRKNQLHSLKD